MLNFGATWLFKWLAAGHRQLKKKEITKIVTHITEWVPEWEKKTKQKEKQIRDNCQFIFTQSNEYHLKNRIFDICEKIDKPVLTNQ